MEHFSSCSFICFFFPVQELINQAGRKLSEWLYLGGVKSFADGSLGSNSALFYEVRTYLFFLGFKTILQMRNSPLLYEDSNYLHLPSAASYGLSDNVYPIIAFQIWNLVLPLSQRSLLLFIMLYLAYIQEM